MTWSRPFVHDLIRILASNARNALSSRRLSYDWEDVCWETWETGIPSEWPILVRDMLTVTVSEWWFNAVSATEAIITARTSWKTNHSKTFKHSFNCHILDALGHWSWSHSKRHALLTNHWCWHSYCSELTWIRLSSRKTHSRLLRLSMLYF